MMMRAASLIPASCSTGARAGGTYPQDSITGGGDYPTYETPGGPDAAYFTLPEVSPATSHRCRNPAAANNGMTAISEAAAILPKS
ncbi:hypothetical protein GCM10022381_13560 [Leifsonia kafniensis]|uniref:Uncharacterized protein n=1 Tax=Leifsonia kafniensis TaxID=475957 RepID=A0ABP7KCS7_9MICO